MTTVDQSDPPAQPALVPLFDINAVARALGLSRVHVRRLIKSGELRAVDVSIGEGEGARPTYRCSQADVDAWIEFRRKRRS